MTRIGRRSLLKALSASALTLPLSGLFAKSVSAGPVLPFAKRLIVFYFPDGVPAPAGEPSRFHATGSQTSFTLPENLAPLSRHRDACVFLRGLTLGPGDRDTHPGGARKLLTGAPGAASESIDRYLSRTVGAGAPFRHLYLGAMSTLFNANGDPFISYVAPKTAVAPDDDPIHAFARLFAAGGALASAPAGGPDPVAKSVIDAAMDDLTELRAKLGPTERSKLDLHVDALRDVERRVSWVGAERLSACTSAPGAAGQVDAGRLYDPAHFPQVLRAQLDLTVQAMACGLTKVAVVQASQHTSELVMSRFAGTKLHAPGLEMRSHEASHYGEVSDPKLAVYVAQRTWFVEQFAYLLDQLAARPDGDGTMLDSSIVLLASEVSDGNTHSHDDMPFVVAGRAGGALRSGRLLSYSGRSHSDLLVTLARAMGDASLSRFGEGGQGVLEGMLA